MNNSLSRLLVLTFLVTLLAGVPSQLFAQGKGKGGGKKPPPVELDIQYRVHHLPLLPDTDLVVRDLSNTLLVVGHLQYDDGRRVGYFYDHESGLAVTLDELISQGDWVALSTNGFTDSSFIGVNDWGLVVGLVESADASIRTGIIVDTRTVPATLHFANVPDFSYSWVRKVNNLGDIAGVYRDSGGDRHFFTYVVNPGITHADYGEPPAFDARSLGTIGWQWMKVTDSRLVFVGIGGSGDPQGVRYDIVADSSLEFVPGGARTMDELGTFGGYRQIVVRNKVKLVPEIWNDDGIIWQADPGQFKYGSNSNAMVVGMNSPSPGYEHGDALIWIQTTTYANYLYKPDYLTEPEADPGIIIDLVSDVDYVDENGDPLTGVSPGIGTHMTERNETGFGAIVGNPAALFVPEFKTP